LCFWKPCVHFTRKWVPWPHSHSARDDLCQGQWRETSWCSGPRAAWTVLAIAEAQQVPAVLGQTPDGYRPTRGRTSLDKVASEPLSAIFSDSEGTVEGGEVSTAELGYHCSAGRPEPSYSVPACSQVHRLPKQPSHLYTLDMPCSPSTGIRLLLLYICSC
jgi:hypothetical protein